VKQSLRLGLAAVLVLALAVIGVGGSSVAISYSEQLTASAKVLDQGVQKISQSGGTLTSALAFADASATPIAVALVAFDNSVTVLQDTDFAFSDSFSAGLLKSASDHAIIIEGETPYQLRAFPTENDEYVLIATSVLAIRAALDRNILILVIASILAIGLGGGLVVWLARRNMKAMIQSLSNSAQQERETRQSMQNFMGDASHELRTPLTVIKGYSELLAKGDTADPEARTRAYERIVEQVNRMDETIASLLELAEVGSISANEFVAVDLAELVSGAAEDLRAMSPTREIEATVAPAEVLGSKNLLGKLLANAIGNIARHAGQKAAVNINLKTVKKYAVLVIEDGGKGLPEEAYAKGVQAFQRFDSSRSRETGGTGLGMSIMNTIVEAHSGTMSISKSKLGGLKLEIQLPLN
jgi:two-component system, OmpR family, sensor kinase